jgi:hypothetical protein
MKLPATLLLVMTIGLLAPAAPASRQRVPEALLAVLRRDGIVTPFAAFDGRRWNVRWPVELRNLEVPISLQDVPGRWWGLDAPPRSMTIWRDGERAGSVAITGLTVTRFMCEPRLALKSDYKPAQAAPPPFETPYPKDGLLVAGDLVVEKIRSVERGSLEWNRVSLVLTDEFNDQESAAARAFESWTHPFSEKQRRARPIAIEALYAAPTRDKDWTAYYVEAVREFPALPQDRDGCGLTTFASGWVIVGADRNVRTRVSARVTYCDRKGVGYMLPFGLIRANGHNYWVFQSSGFESEWYEVAEPTHRNVDGQVAYRAGTCGI